MALQKGAISKPLTSIIDDIKTTISATLELFRMDLSPAMMPSRDLLTHQEVKIENGGVLNSGDKFKIRIRLEQDCFVCILFKDSKGQLSPIVNEKVDAFKEFELGEFELDENIGDESILLLASMSPIEDLDKKIEIIAETDLSDFEKMFSDIIIQSLNFKHK